MTRPVSAPVRLQTHIWNPMGDRRALLLHGLTSDGVCWWRLASELADAGWMVVAPDLRSHGRSPTAVDHSVRVLADDVALLGDGYGLVVGHSLGGAAAAVLLGEAGFADAAVLVDPVLRLDSTDREPLRARMHTEVGRLDASAVREANAAWDERDVQRKILAAALVTPDVVDLVLDHNDPWDVTEDVGRSVSRIHLLAADAGRGGLLSSELAASLADGRRVTFELAGGVGHSVHREAPRLVSAAVARVLGAHA